MVLVLHGLSGLQNLVQLLSHLRPPGRGRLGGGGVESLLDGGGARRLSRLAGVFCGWGVDLFWGFVGE